jgi:O-antigen/teichoic acid export membrane protein
MSSSTIRALVSRGYRDSVVRRSFILLCLIGPAFAINLVLYYVAGTLLSPENFGLFYIAITTVNVLYSGSFVLNIFFTRYLVSVIQTAGEPAAHFARSRIVGLTIRWGALGALVCTLALAGFGKLIGIQSLAIVVLIVLDAYSSYIVDINRAFLQSQRRTVLLGTITLTWMALRFLLAVAGMALFGAVWAGVLGAVLAAPVTIAFFSLFIYSEKVGRPQSFPPLPSARALVPVVLGYVSLIVVSNLDVLLIYLLLKNEALGTYSSSSILPKGILVVVTPLLQMLYPMMVSYEKAPPNVRIVFQRSTGVIFVLASVMALGVFEFSGVLCGGPWGLKLCRHFPLQFLLISAVMLSVLRVVVLYQSARGRDWLALSMLAPAAAYLWIAEASSHNVDTIAVQFAVFSALVLAYFGGLTLLAERR